MVRTDQRSEQRTLLHVIGMDCPDEIAELRRLLSGRDGVLDLSFNLMQATMTVRHVPSVIDANQIREIVGTTGMTASAVNGSSPADRFQTGVPRGPLRMTILSGVATALGCGLSFLPLYEIHHTAWLAVVMYLAAIGAGWWYVVPKAWSALRHGRLDMNVLMTIAVVGAVGLGEWLEASTVAFLFMLSHLLESWSVARARRAIQSLIELSPPKARVQDDDGAEREIDTNEVRVGDRIIVKPGEKFPLDGCILEGTTAVNQAPITGESALVNKRVGDEVFAATINQDGAVVVEVAKLEQDTVLAGVIRLVEQAQSQRSPSERFVDRFARYYTPAVVVGAVLVCVVPPVVYGAAWTDWFYRALVMLVIACPCALVISTPVSIVSGLASAARNGVLIKGGEYLESIGSASIVALDKTGTLTSGRPVVQEVISLNGSSRESLLRTAAAIELRSGHPIGEAIVAHARAMGIDPPACGDFQALHGKGARAAVDGVTHLLGNHRLLEEHGLCTEEVHRVMVEHEDCDHIAVAVSSLEAPLGVVLLADGLRAEAIDAVAGLRRQGVERIVMLTGDNAGTAKAIAEQCGSIEYRAELLPADKVDAVAELKSNGRRVVMVGDGVNDAPALAAADVGIAIGAGGTDAALETADIALMTADLGKLPWLIAHGRRTRRVIAQNIGLSLAIKGIVLALAIPGHANLWLAIVADMGASLLVTFNGLRLLRTSATHAKSCSLSNKKTA